MQHFKLIAVINLDHLKTYKAQGLKIIEELDQISIHSDKTYAHEKGKYKKTSNPGSSFEAHTDAKEIRHEISAKSAVKYLDNILTKDHSYHELLIAAEPKTLGFVRKLLTQNLQKSITKQISKDLVHAKIDELEKVFFG